MEPMVYRKCHRFQEGFECVLHSSVGVDGRNWASKEESYTQKAEDGSWSPGPHCEAV